MLRRRLVTAGSQQRTNVLDHDDLGAHDPDRGRDLVPQPRPVPALQARPGPGGADVLARETRAEDLNRLNLGPVHLRDVAEVLRVGEAVREDRGRPRIVVGNPGEFATEDGLDG